MTRTNRALTVLALSLALAAGTTAVAAAAPSIPSAVQDQNDRLLRSIETAQAERTQTAVEQARAIERDATAAQPAAAVQDQNDRLLQSLQAGQAERTQTAVAQARAIERNLGPVPVVTVAASPVSASGGDDVNLLPVLLLGLVGGLAGGAAIAALAAASRRHAQRAVAA
jgi:hypothetical protein